MCQLTPCSRMVLTVMQGWLVKQGGGTKTILSRRNWKRRWFVLQGHQLTYHKTKDFVVLHDPPTVRAASLGCINLADTYAIRQWDGKPYGIAIDMPSRNYCFTASSSKEQRAWISILNIARDQGVASLSAALSSHTGSTRSGCSRRSSSRRSSTNISSPRQRRGTFNKVASLGDLCEVSGPSYGNKRVNMIPDVVAKATPSSPEVLRRRESYSLPGRRNPSSSQLSKVTRMPTPVEVEIPEAITEVVMRRRSQPRGSVDQDAATRRRSAVLGSIGSSCV